MPFSTENWKRPKYEVDFLMRLLDRWLEKELPNTISFGQSLDYWEY